MPTTEEFKGSNFRHLWGGGGGGEWNAPFRVIQLDEVCFERQLY